MGRFGRKTRAILAVATLTLMAAGLIRLAGRGEPPSAREARAALAAGRTDEAAAAAARWLAADPWSAAAHLIAGRVALERKQPAEAAGELQQALRLDPAVAGAPLLRALIAAAVGRSGEAEPELSRAFAAAEVPDRPVDEALARIWIEAFDLQRAALVLDRWARDFPADPKPHLWRAEIDSRTGGDAAAAQADYRAALARDPTLTDARMKLADDLARLHRPAEALAEYDFVLARQPDHALAHLGAAQVQAELGDDAAADGHLGRALALAPAVPAVHQAVAEAAGRRGDWAAMLAALDRAAQFDPDDLTTSYRRGVALANLGRAEEARTEQARAARLRTDLARLNEARARLVGDPHDRVSQLTIARWMFGHAHPADGVRWAEKVLREWADDPDASQLLADHYRQTGELGLANFYRLHAPSKP